MMNKDGLLTLYDYDTYANHLVLDVVARLSEAEFVRRASASHGSVRMLLLHMLGVQEGYLNDCLQRPTERPTLQTFAAIRDYWNRLGEDMRAFIVASTDADLVQELEITLGGHPFRFPRWQMLMQALVHSSHHRGELSIILTELGYPLPTLDIIIQFAEQSGQPWPWKA
ncbi:MAG TPA: DinB family protein [Aggregatilineaceae bacterium]|nr:DinB family protein [Aggregatilineaceae bacterium]